MTAVAALPTKPGVGGMQAVLHAGDGSALVVPGGILLLVADYQRVGSDLVLVGPDGTRIVVADYFALENPPDLLTAGGAVITPETVRALAGPLAPGQYAQAAPAAGSAPIGKVEKLSGEVVAQRPDGTKVVLAKGDVVYQGDVIVTGDGAGIGIVFVDDTAFSLGAKGRMVLDEMVFDSAAKTGQSSFSVIQGAFSFVSGKVAKVGPDAMKVKTPVMTIGIRGTTVAGYAAAEGEESWVTLLSDADGGAGQIMVYNQAGQRLLSLPNQTVQLASAMQDVPPPFTLTPAQVEARYGHAVAHRPEPGGAEGGERGEQEAPGGQQEGEGGDGEGEDKPADSEEGQAQDAAPPAAEEAAPAAAPAEDAEPAADGDKGAEDDTAAAPPETSSTPGNANATNNAAPSPAASVPDTQTQVQDVAPPPPPPSATSSGYSAEGANAGNDTTTSPGQALPTAPPPPATPTGTVTNPPATSAPPPNQAPQASGESYTVAEDGVLAEGAAGVLGNDSDADGQPLSAALVSGPEHGSLSLDSDGGFTYTPDANFFGTDSFAYSADDGLAQSEPTTVTVTVTPVNDAPVAADDSLTVAEDQSLTVAAGGVLSNDADVEGDPLSAALVSGPEHGSLSLDADGGLTYTPDANFFGTDSFTYRASDGKLESGEATVSITVTPVPDPPVAADDSYALGQDESLTVAADGVLGNDADPEGEPLSAVLVSGPANGSLSLDGDGGFTYTPDKGFFGTDSFTYRAADGKVESEAATVSITVTKAVAPVAADDSYALDEDGTLSVAAAGVLGNDTGAEGDTLSAALVSGPDHGSLSFDADGGFTYTPDANFFGSDGFTYRAGNGKAESGDASVSITVTPVADAPVAADDAYSLGDAASLTVAAAGGVLANDTDADGDGLEMLLVTGPAHGTLSIDADGGFVYTPGGDYSGADSFTYRASDGSQESNLATVTLTGGQVEVNHAPVLGTLPGTLALHADFDALAGGDWASLSGGGLFGPAEFPGGNALYFDEAGARVVTTAPLDVSDGGTVAFSLGLAGDSDLPHFGSSAPGENVVLEYSTDGGTTWFEIDRYGSGEAWVAGGTFDSDNVVASDNSNYWPWGDANNQRYQIWVSAEVLDGFAGTVSQIRHFATSADATGYELQVYLSSGVPDADALSADDLDANHGDDRTLVFDGTLALTGTELTIDVDDVFAYSGGNLLIDYVFESFTGVGQFYDGPLWQAVYQNEFIQRITDHALEGPEVLDWGALRTEISVEFNGWSKLSYTIPDAAKTGATMFRWSQEGHSGADNDQWALDHVAIRSAAAVATDDVAFTYELPDGLFTDPDGDDLTLTASLADGNPLPGWLTFDGTTGTFSGTPADADVGTLALRVKASDPHGASVLAKLTITVCDANDAPVVDSAIADQDATENAPFDFVVPANTFGDADGDALTLTATLAGGGALPDWLSFNASTRTFAGTPTNADVGGITVRVTASDGSESVFSDFTLTVGDVENAPTAADDSYQMDEDGTLTVVASGVLANDTDLDGDALAAVLVSGPSHGTLSLAADGGFGYAPNADFSGTDSFSYHADDGGQTSGDVIVTIEVAAVNDDPEVVTNAGMTVVEGGSEALSSDGLEVADVDNDADEVVFTLTATPTRGTLSLDASPLGVGGTFTQADVGAGRVAYSHAGGGTADDFFSFTVSDGTSTPVPGSFSIDVTSATETSWVGPTGADYSWHTTANWDPAVPGDDGRVTISGAPPVYSTGTTSLDELTIAGGGLSVTGGTLKVSGALTVAADTALVVSAGTLGLAGGTTLSGGGLVSFAGGTFSLSGDLAFGASSTPTFLFGGNITIADSDGDGQTVPTLTNEHAELDLSNEVVNVNFVNAAAAQAISAGTDFNGTLTNSGDLYVRTAWNYMDGAVSNASGANLIVEGTGSANGALNIATGFDNLGTIQLTSTASAAVSLTVAGDTLVNQGSLVVDAGGGGARSITAQITNEGTIDVNADTTLQNSGRTFDARMGTIDIADGKTLTVGGGTTLLDPTTLAGSGTIAWSQGTLNLAGDWTLVDTGAVLGSFTGDITIGNGSNIDTPVLTNERAELALDGETMDISFANSAGAKAVLWSTDFNADVANAGEIVARGNSNYIGNFTNAANAELTIEGVTWYAGALTIGTGFTNEGTITLTSSDATNAGLTVTSGTLVNAGTMAIEVGGGGARTIYAAIENTGTLTVNKSATISGASLAHSNSGVIDIADGQTLTISGSGATITNSGTIQGAGTLAFTDGASLTDGGTIDPGSDNQDDTGHLVISGGGAWTNASIFNVGIKSGGFDQLTVSGALAIDGTLRVRAIGNYDPAEGTEFGILVSGTALSGAFGSIEGLDCFAGKGKALDPTFSGTSFTLTARAANVGTSVADNLVGSGSADYLLGAGGDDILTGGGGADVLMGQDGADILEVADSNFHFADGGDGYDVLAWRPSSGGTVLDLGDVRDDVIQRIEQICLGNGPTNGVVLRAADVLGMTEGTNEGTGTADTLIIGGDANDVVTFADGIANWTSQADQTVDGISYSVYAKDGALVYVLQGLQAA